VPEVLVPEGDTPLSSRHGRATARHGSVSLAAALLTGSLLAVPQARAASVIATIPVGNNPHGVAVNPTTNRIYVANTTDDTVTVINGADNSVITTVSVGNQPFGVAVHAAQKTYADSGLMPELLGVYHLLGDPAMIIR